MLIAHHTYLFVTKYLHQNFLLHLILLSRKQVSTCEDLLIQIRCSAKIRRRTPYPTISALLPKTPHQLPRPRNTPHQNPTTTTPLTTMKILTTSFLTCAVKACKSSPLSFPLHYKDAELEQSDIAYNPQFLINILPRIDWDAVRTTAAEVTILAFVSPISPSYTLEKRSLRDVFCDS